MYLTHEVANRGTGAGGAYTNFRFLFVTDEFI